MKNNKTILFNPKSANGKHRIPNSILQVGASIHGKFEYVFVDGNLEIDEVGTVYLSLEDYTKKAKLKNLTTDQTNINTILMTALTLKNYNQMYKQ